MDKKTSGPTLETNNTETANEAIAKLWNNRNKQTEIIELINELPKYILFSKHTDNAQKNYSPVNAYLNKLYGIKTQEENQISSSEEDMINRVVLKLATVETVKEDKIPKYAIRGAVLSVALKNVSQILPTHPSITENEKIIAQVNQLSDEVFTHANNSPLTKKNNYKSLMKACNLVISTLSQNNDNIGLSNNSQEKIQAFLEIFNKMNNKHQKSVVRPEETKSTNIKPGTISKPSLKANSRDCLLRKNTAKPR